MKDEREDFKTEEKKYPKLMICDSYDRIVLMYTKGCGTLLSTAHREGVPEDIGEYVQIWNMDNFKDYNGKVTLEN